MKMGIKEFREQLGHIARGDDVVELTHHGRVVGTYTPKRKFDPERARAAVESIKRWQAEMRDQGIDTEAVLAEMGLDPWGAPLEHSDDR